MTNKIITFGCRLNEFESQKIQNNLERYNQHNYTIINTCSVTQEAIKKAKKAIKKEKKHNPHNKIIVTGCAAQIDPKAFANIKETDLVLGNTEKLNISKYLNNSTIEETKQINQSFTDVSDKVNTKIITSDIMSETKIDNDTIVSFSGKSRAFLQVQSGCNHRCTFCTIPFARGNNRSVPLENLIAQGKAFLSQGYREIVLTGVDITNYGEDLVNKPT